MFLLLFDDLFLKVDELIVEVLKRILYIFIDFYVEVISEKFVFGWYIDGWVLVVVGIYIYV